MLNEVKELFFDRLSAVYEPRELANIWRLYKEDVLDSMILEDVFELEKVKSDIQRLKIHEPIQYITNLADFYGEQYYVDSRVLIPRPETEELLDWLIKDFKGFDQRLRFLDIGTGSGCIVNTLARHLPMHDFTAIDVSQEALQLARHNAKNIGVDINFFRFDFTDESSWQKLGEYDVIVSNPPYVSIEEEEHVSTNALQYEPHLAIFSKKDPLLFYKLIEHFSRTHLTKQGSIYLELNEFYAKEIVEIFTNNRQRLTLKQDMQRKDRMLRINQ